MSFNHILEDRSLLQWLHGNLNSDVDMVPKQRSMQVKVSTQVLTDQSCISSDKVFMKVSHFVPYFSLIFTI